MNEHCLPYPRRLAPAYALGYIAVLPQFQAIARRHGYALAVHGSMATDLDLLACPWTDEATDAETLIESLRAHMNGFFAEREWDTNPSARPHGRRAWSLYATEDGAKRCEGPYYDISVMPRSCDGVMPQDQDRTETTHAH